MPEQVDECVEALKREGRSEDEAWAICQAEHGEAEELSSLPMSRGTALEALAEADEWERADPGVWTDGEDVLARESTPEGVPEGAEYVSPDGDVPDDAQVHKGPGGATYITRGDDGDDNEPDGPEPGETYFEEGRTANIVPRGTERGDTFFVDGEEAVLINGDTDSGVFEFSDGSQERVEWETGRVSQAEDVKAPEESAYDVDLKVGEDIEPVPSGPDGLEDTDVVLDGERLTVRDVYGSETVQLFDSNGEEVSINENFQEKVDGVIERDVTPDDLSAEDKRNAAKVLASGATSPETGSVRSDWRDFGEVLDNMDSGDIADATLSYLENSTGAGGGDDVFREVSLEDIADADFDEDTAGSPSRVQSKHLGPAVSRMDPEDLNDFVDRAAESDDVGTQTVANAAVAFAPDDDVRQEVMRKHGASSDAAKMATARDFDDFKSSWIDGWSRRGGSDTAILTQMALDDFGPNDDSDTFAWTTGLPMGDVDIPDQVTEGLQQMYENTQEQIDGPQTLRRGVSTSVATHSNLESWSEDKTQAEKFDDHVMEAEVDPEHVLATYETLGEEWPEEFVVGKKEFMVLGGAF